MRDPLMSVKEIAKRHLSPFMLHCVKQAYHRVLYGGPEWEFCPQGWAPKDSKIKGWNVGAIARTQQAKWPAFLQAIKGTGPLTIAHEAPLQSEKNFHAHHLLMAYAYVLTLAALKKDKIALLDWGGGIGHYCLLSRCILPELLIEYHCKDVPLLCKTGREMLTEATFFEQDEEIVRGQLRDAYSRIMNHEFSQGCGKPECHWCNFARTYELIRPTEEVFVEIDDV